MLKIVIHRPLKCVSIFDGVLNHYSLEFQEILEQNIYCSNETFPLNAVNAILMLQSIVALYGP